MIRTTTLGSHSDGSGNRIIYDGPPSAGGATFNIRGSNNVVEIHHSARFGRLSVMMDGSNSKLTIGANHIGSTFKGFFRIGEDSTVTLGDDVTSTESVYISAVEGTTVAVGDDVMFSTGNQVRSDDSHPIFDVNTGLRVNPARSINIGAHVWLGFRSLVMGGSSIGEGTVVGADTIVKGNFPNNCVVAGSPPRVVRKDVAWERPHLSINAPFYKPDSTTVKKSPYWNVTNITMNESAS